MYQSASTNSSGMSSMSNSFSDGSTDVKKSRNGSNFIFAPPTGSLDTVDKGTLLLGSLNILSALRTMEMEKDKKDKGKGRNLTTKKDSKNDTQGKSFEFTKDMFHFINMDAFIHVTHFLFDTYDPKETEQRFRNSWPIYDKKMEGVYRRVVLEWLKEIVEKFPRFFRGLKVEAIGGLIVNPGGERFLKLIHSFCTFIMYQVCQRKQQQGYIKGTIHDYFESNSAAPQQIKNKQIYILQSSINRLTHESLEAQKKLVKGTLQHRKLMEELQNRKHANDSQFDDSKLELFKKVQRNSELFPENAAALIERRRDYISKISSFEQLISGNVAPDPLCKVLKEKIKLKSVETMEKLNDIKSFFDRHERLWLFLRMDRTNPVALDGSKLFKSRGRDDEYSSLNTFIASAASAINVFCTKENIWEATDSSAVDRCTSLKQRHQFLKLRASDLRKTDGDLELYRKNLDFECKILSLKLNEIDWRYLSDCDNVQSMANMLTLTPAKMFDVNRTTGYTPALNMFLSHTFKDTSGTPSRFQSEFRHSARVDGEPKLKTSLREFSLNQATAKANGVSKLSLFSNSLNNSPNHNETVVDSPKRGVTARGNVNGQIFSPRFSKVQKTLPEVEITLNIYPLKSDQDKIGSAGDGPLIGCIASQSSQSRGSIPEPSAEVRISRLLDSLKETSFGEVKNGYHEESMDSKFGNNSFVDDWENEKGLLDMSISNVSFLNEDNL